MKIKTLPVFQRRVSDRITEQSIKKA